MKKRMILGLAVLAAVLFVVPATVPAAVISFSSGSFDMISIGDTLGTSFDQVHIFALSDSFTITPGTPTDYVINTGSFVAGPNTYLNNVNYGPFDATRSFSVNGVSGSISQPFSVNINYSDTLYLSNGATTSFNLGSLGILNVTALGLDPIVNGGGTLNGNLYARFDLQPVPEPGTMMLLGSGLVGLAGWGRKKLLK